MALEAQTGGEIRARRFFAGVIFSLGMSPDRLPAGPSRRRMVPLKRFLDPADYKALVLDTRPVQLTARAESLLHDVVNRLWAAGRGSSHQAGSGRHAALVDRLYPEQEKLSDAQRQARSMDLVKVILVHSYMDGLNFDLGRTKKCISRTVLPDGRLMPTCAYNVIHRSGHPTRRSG